MKKGIFILLALLGFTSVSLTAQDAWLSYKDAKAYLGKYKTLPSQNADQFDNAIESIDKAIEGISSIEKSKDKYKVYEQAGEIYTMLASMESRKAIASPDYKSPYDKPSVKAQQYLEKSLSFAEKSFQKGDVMEAMFKNVNNLLLKGNALLNAQEYEGAYEAYKSLLNASDLMTENEYPNKIFKTEDELNSIRYVVGVTAIESDKKEEGLVIIEGLLEEGYEKPEVYEQLYRAYEADGNMDKALKYLKLGREKDPSNKGLLYAEINYALKAGEMESLVGKLDEAIADDPENGSLYTTLGFVYDNLFQKADEAGEAEEAQMYFDKALAAYKKSTEVDEESEANYSIGALYYNKAAVTTQKMAAIADDMSASATKKYNAYQEEADRMFDLALPYFQKAERHNPNDVNTLNALKEIYAKKGTEEDIEKSKELRQRIENVQSGVKNESSMF